MTNKIPNPTGNLSWVRSSYSGNNGNCVEVASLPGGGRAVRDSKDHGGPILSFTVGEWAAFVNCARGGEFGN
ncbi:DUF397 domain-containing protein [Streptomyces bauhiniae]